MRIYLKLDKNNSIFHYFEASSATLPNYYKLRTFPKIIDPTLTFRDLNQSDDSNLAFVFSFVILFAFVFGHVYFKVL